jgi:LSD1 subclass zinc finger protein
MTEYSAVFNCPGCGSPLETPEGTISLRCSYCGLIMRLGSPGRILKYYYESRVDDFAVKFASERYLKEKGFSLKFSVVKTECYHLPFYRFRGMSYALFCKREAMPEDADMMLPAPRKKIYHKRCRHFDLTIPGFTEKSFGLDSLGIRPEVIPLKAYHKSEFPENSVVLDMVISPDEAVQQAMAMFFFNIGIATDDKEYLSSEMIGEGLSVIYYPVSVCVIDHNGMLSTLFVDGLAKHVYNETPGEADFGGKGIDNSSASELNPVQHKCPNCGFDLPVSQRSLFYYCENCDRSYMIGDDTYHKVEARCAAHESRAQYHPFWRFPFSVKDRDTVGKFSKILTGEIPLIARSKKDNKFYLYIPAFRSTNLDSLTSLGLRLCRVQPELEIKGEMSSPASEMVLPPSEGLELASWPGFTGTCCDPNICILRAPNMDSIRAAPVTVSLYGWDFREITVIRISKNPIRR